jgi:alpha-ribazole phosphatase
MARLLLIRHARSSHAGLAGRRDVPATPIPAPELAQARQHLAALWGGAPPRIFSSPAQRCVQTAQALFPDIEAATDARLWEQDFGAWEGLESAALPDLGPLSCTETASMRPPGGESFLDLTSRTAPALQEIAAGGAALIFAHAGTIRTALGLALGDMAQALTFEIATFSATRLQLLPEGGWSIGFVNLPLLPP